MEMCCEQHLHLSSKGNAMHFVLGVSRAWPEQLPRQRFSPMNFYWVDQAALGGQRLQI
jgi:hypothetical protein